MTLMYASPGYMNLERHTWGLELLFNLLYDSD